MLSFEHSVYFLYIMFIIYQMSHDGFLGFGHWG